jgi:hypothetical protein
MDIMVRALDIQTTVVQTVPLAMQAAEVVVQDHAELVELVIELLLPVVEA